MDHLDSVVKEWLGSGELGSVLAVGPSDWVQILLSGLLQPGTLLLLLHSVDVLGLLPSRGLSETSIAATAQF